MATMVRVLVERADGSRVTELLSGTPLDAVDSGRAKDLGDLLMAWALGSAPVTMILAVGAARRAIDLEPPGSILTVRRASVTDSVMPRVLRTSPPR